MDSKQSLIKKNNRDIASVSSLQHEYAAAFDGKNKLKKKQLTVKGIAMPRVYCALEKLNVLAFYSLYYTYSKNTIGSV
jgi:hypothetical protein